jgi:putative addiction module killer protein
VLRGGDVRLTLRRCETAERVTHAVWPVGGVNELPIDEDPGYRVYYSHRGAFPVILLCKGNRSMQQADIDLRKTLPANRDTD